MFRSRVRASLNARTNRLQDAARPRTACERQGGAVGSILNEADRTAIERRIGAVTSASAPRWGRMDAQAMLAHLRLSALMALGDVPVVCKSHRAFHVFPIKHLILHVAPFPRSAPTAPELLIPHDASIEMLRPEIVSLLERIGAGPRDGDGPVHPLFGRLSLREWGVATFKHTDHHLRQFGA